mgnify:CR=1 FL=1
MILADGSKERYRVLAYHGYFENLKRNFLYHQNNFVADFRNRPDPTLCDLNSPWLGYAQELITESDNLSLISGIRKTQIKKLHQANINSLKGLAEAKIRHVNGIAPESFIRLKAQAEIQNASRELKRPLFRILKNEDLAAQEGGRVINLTDKVNKAKALNVFVRFFKKNNKNVKTIAVGDNYNDLDMLKTSDFPCLVFNDKFTLDEIPINNITITNKPSPEGWADVIKKALVKITKN